MSCYPEPCPVALPAKVDSPVEAGVDFPDSGEDVGFADRWGASCKEVADEVRQKGGAPAEGLKKHFRQKGAPRRGVKHNESLS